VLDRRIEGRATRPARAALAPPQQIPMPSRQGVPTDQEAPAPPLDRTRAAAARNARSAVVNRTRLPPRRWTLSWWRSTTVSRSSSSRPQRTRRRSSQHRSRYRMDQSIRAV
jgi:hypothetical protein